MPIERTSYETADFLGLYEDENYLDLTGYWSDNFFPNTHLSEDEFIDFTKMNTTRVVAPFVVQTHLGVPLPERGSKLTRMTPAYIKLLNQVNPGRSLRRHPKEALQVNKMSPAERIDAIRAEIFMDHDAAIRRKHELMAARAIIDGSATIESPFYPTRTVSFDRDPAHSVVKAPGAVWGTAGVSILDDIQGWVGRIRTASYGGAPSRLTVGADAWNVMRKDAEIEKELNTEIRGSSADLNRGLRDGSNVTYVGKLASFLDVFVYSETYQDEVTGLSTQVLDQKSVVLTAPGVEGYRAFGIIPEEAANYSALPIFPRSYWSDNPQVENILTQSSPLMVPVNPNCTLRAKVLV